MSSIEQSSALPDFVDFVAGGRGCGLIAARFPAAGRFEPHRSASIGHAGWRGRLLHALDALVLWYPRLLGADVTGSIRRSSGLAHIEECALPGSPVPRNATFPAQGDNCRKTPRRAAPSWLD